jgi:hypothetical protein
MRSENDIHELKHAVEQAYQTLDSRRAYEEVHFSSDSFQNPKLFRAKIGDTSSGWAPTMEGALVRLAVETLAAVEKLASTARADRMRLELALGDLAGK